MFVYSWGKVASESRPKIKIKVMTKVNVNVIEQGGFENPNRLMNELAEENQFFNMETGLMVEEVTIGYFDMCRIMVKDHNLPNRSLIVDRIEDKVVYLRTKR